ncbi:MAG: hypothetical protein HUJ26_17375 [Planctomycetaceae bacterium]|nr:hypothetical protein [Planctomycetaceae bacterium]
MTPDIEAANRAKQQAEQALQAKSGKTDEVPDKPSNITNEQQVREMSDEEQNALLENHPNSLNQRPKVPQEAHEIVENDKGHHERATTTMIHDDDVQPNDVPSNDVLPNDVPPAVNITRGVHSSHDDHTDETDEIHRNTNADSNDGRDSEISEKADTETNDPNRSRVKESISQPVLTTSDVMANTISSTSTQQQSAVDRTANQSKQSPVPQQKPTQAAKHPKPTRKIPNALAKVAQAILGVTTAAGSISTLGGLLLLIGGTNFWNPIGWGALLGGIAVFGVSLAGMYYVERHRAFEPSKAHNA